MLDTKTRWLYDQIISQVVDSEKVVTSMVSGIPDSYSDQEIEEAITKVHEWIAEAKIKKIDDVINYCKDKVKEMEASL